MNSFWKEFWRKGSEVSGFSIETVGENVGGIVFNGIRLLRIR